MARCTLLFLTHNRLAYTKRSAEALLACEGDFTIWIWDNGSTDGTADFVSSLRTHPRVERVHLSTVNAMQNTPFMWVLDECESPLIGKVDDDCVLPQRWIDPISEALMEHEQLGAIGCWTFWPEDFDETQAVLKIKRFGRHQVLTNISIGGTGLLIRRQTCRRFLLPVGFAIPVDQNGMSASGFVNGWYYPLIWAEHMDDPRSPYCMMRSTDGLTDRNALTARRNGHKTASDYEQWIRRDCALNLGQTTEQQIRMWRRSRLKKNIRRNFGSVGHIARQAWGFVCGERVPSSDDARR